MRKFWKWVKYIGGSLILLGIGSYFVFQIYFWVLNKRAKGQLEKKSTLTEQGYTYRDLNNNGILDPYEDSRNQVELRVDDLLGQMTVRDKVGMLWHPPIGVGKKGKVMGKPALMNPASTYDAIINQKIRHFNLFTVPRTKHLASWYNAIQKIAEQDRLGIPITISSDPRHGIKNFLEQDILGGDFSKWPEPLGLAAIGDSSFMVKFAEIANKELRAVGIRTALHPMADLATEPRWARINGTFGEDADLASKLTAAYINGFQGEELNASSVACMTKHWPGGGPQKDGEDAHFSYGKDQAYPGDNFEYHLKPFAAALKAGTAMIMPYYGIPKGQTSENVGMSFNKEIIQDLLRSQYEYDGIVCSDWGILEGFSFAGVEIIEAKDWGVEDLTVEQKIAKSLDAGVDQFGGNANIKELLQLVESGEIPEARLDESVRRLLKAKFKLGLFDNPYVDVVEAEKIIGNTAHQEAADQAQRKSIVLLKNGSQGKGKILPLISDVKMYLENVDPEIAANYGRVMETVEDADIAVLRLQTPWDQRDDDFVEQFFHQGDLDFDPEERARLLSIMNRIPTVLCIYVDRPPVMPELNRAAVGVLAEFGASDDAVLDVIFGRFNPQGKLPLEIPSSMEAVKSQKEDVPYDSPNPLYKFGFGLNY